MLRYDVIVIGGGHAGVEASAMAARMGARTLLLTQNLETIGHMSCNPAIGGIAKGTVVREVDALGGVMGRATDLACLQFRMLNRSKGPAVWSPRAQCDRGLYRRAVRLLLERLENLDFAQGTVSNLLLDGAVRRVVTKEGRGFEASAVVLTAGTFLRGQIHLGLGARFDAGRAGEPATAAISEVLGAQGLTIERFKTGTPPRIDGRTADLRRLVRQDSDPGDYRFSFFAKAERPPQRPCYLTYAGSEAKEIIQSHLKESALYGGAISGKGPRYCPSIEDKVVKFPRAERHQVFLEPEGLETTEMYVNGLSTSLPPDVQLRFLRTVPGLESVHMTRPGYAIEYDYFPPTQLLPSLEVRGLKGLFLAGQVNGTTGYEEAAGQGVIAGLNAAARALDRDPVVLSRSEAFIGVLIDDLVTRGVDEPYRLFTSRAEFRLLLRQDNALRRLFPLADRLGLLNEEERGIAVERMERDDRCLGEARSQTITPGQANQWLVANGAEEIREPMRVASLAKRPGSSLFDLLRLTGLEVDPDSCRWAEIELRYEGYLAREATQAARLARFEELAIPPDMALANLQGLSHEAREKLGARRPATVGQASRIPGVSPADLHSLIFEVLRGQRAVPA
jgi:tRNA uridine 5-carboxymethylaminomethyl modification enzyme